MEVKDENTPFFQEKVLNGDCDFRRKTPGVPLKPVNDDRRLSSQRMKTSSPTKVTPSNSPYTYIRQLDSAERWIERTSVLTKQDHALNLQHASSILEDIVNSLPVSNVSNNWINKEPIGKDETHTQKNQDAQISISNNFVEVDELASLLSVLDLSVSFSTETPVPKNPGSKSFPALAFQGLDAKDSALMAKVHSTDDLITEHVDLITPVNRHSKSHLSCSSLTAGNKDSRHNLSKHLTREQLEKQIESKDQVIVKQGNPVDPFKPCSQLENSINISVQLNCQSPKHSQHDNQVTELLSSVRDTSDLQNKSGHYLDPVTLLDEQYVKAGSFKPEEKLDDVIDLNVDQRQQKTKLVNSPAPGKLDITTDEPNLNDEPFKPKAQLVNSPIASKHDGVMVEKDLTVNPFESKAQLVNSPIAGKHDGAICEKDLTVNPFESKAQLVNSPIAGKHDGAICEKDLTVNPFKTKIPPAISPVTRKLDGITDEVDLFQPKAQLCNSPSVRKPDTDDHNITDKLSLNIESFTQNENEQYVNALTIGHLVGDKNELNLTVKPFEANLAISPFVSKKLEVSIGELKVTPLKTKTQDVGSRAMLMVEKSSNELDISEDQFIPRAQLVNSPPSLGKLDSAEYKHNLSASEAQTDTSIDKPDLNVKSLKSKGQHLNSRPTKHPQGIMDVLHPKGDQFNTEAQLKSAGGNFDIEYNEVRNSLSAPSSQLLSSSSGEEKSDLIYNQIQNTLDELLVDEIQKFSIQGTNTPNKNITHMHNSMEVHTVDAQLVTEMSSSSNTLEFNPVLNQCVTQKIQKEIVCSTTPTNNCQDKDEQIVSKEMNKSKDPSSLDNQKVKNCESIHLDIDKKLEDKYKLTIEDPNASNKSGDQISAKASILTPMLQTKSSQILSNTNISIHPSNLQTKLINTPSTNNQTSCNNHSSKLASKGPCDHENDSGIESTNATNITSQEIANPAKDKDMEQNVFNIEPFKDHSDQGPCAQEEILPADSDKPFIVNDDKRSFPKHLAVDESIPITPKVKESSHDDGTKDESIPFSPQENEIGENEMFIPATEAFNDPAFFDMLEHTSNSKAPNSKRGSVLLKFDPLQDRRESLAPKSLNTSPDTAVGQAQKPGQMSDVFKDPKLGISFNDESVCLFGTPPRVARRRTLTRRVHNYRAQSIEEENSSNEVDMIFGTDNDGDGMDTIINDNLHPLHEGPRLIDIGEMPIYTEKDVKQIRADLTMHFQELILKKDREFQEKLKEQGQLLELEKEKSKTEADGLKQKNKSLHGKLKSLNEVMKGYTDIISQLSVEKDKAQLEVEKVTVELSELQKYNSQVMEDNKTLEKSFDDLFHRYEKLKQTLEKAAENEKVLKQAVQSAQEKYKATKESARKIKEVAEAKIAEQDEKYEKLSSSTKSELTRLEASLKMKDMQVQGLENTLEQKRKENKELTDLCDSLINRVSSN